LVSPLRGLEELLVKEGSEKGIRSKRRDDPGISAEGFACDLTSDDVGTIVGICVAFLIVSVTVAAYIICVSSLLLLLTRAIPLLRLHLSRL
jgi:hypothetical protein